MKTYPRKKSAFTLVELLVVIAIIGILAGLLIPGVGAAIKNASIADARTQFANMASGISQYKQEYGYYPAIGELRQGKAIDLGEDGNGDAFAKALTGYDVKGDEISLGDPLNRKQRRFFTFSEGEIDDQGRVVDNFGNYHIFIAVDHDGDGVINLDEVGEKGVDDKMKEAAELLEADPPIVRAKVILWTTRNLDVPDSEYVFTWK